MRWQIESRLRREVKFKWIEGSKLIVRNGMTGATGNIYCGLQTRQVEVRTLDEILEGVHPILIKIDVEGYEPEVITGAQRTLQNPSLLALQIETVNKYIKGEVEAAGFHQASYDPFMRHISLSRENSLGAPSNNYLFIRDLDVCADRVAAAARRSVAGHSI